VKDYEYSAIIKPYLDSRSIYTIDTVFLTHEHIDHYGSLPFLIEDKAVENIVTNPYFMWTDELIIPIEENKIDITYAYPQQIITVKGHDFLVLSPLEDMASANNNSLVLHTVFGQLSWLFTGDIEEEAEKKILQFYDYIKVDVLKVAHHGSSTSTSDAFLQKLRPDYALIPVGLNNMYRHPSNEVIKALEQDDIHIYRTDLDGAIQYVYDSRSVWFEHFLKHK